MCSVQPVLETNQREYNKPRYQILSLWLRFLSDNRRLLLENNHMSWCPIQLQTLIQRISLTGLRYSPLPLRGFHDSGSQIGTVTSPPFTAAPALPQALSTVLYPVQSERSWNLHGMYAEKRRLVKMSHYSWIYFLESTGKRKRAKGVGIRLVYESSLLNLFSWVHGQAKMDQGHGIETDYLSQGCHIKYSDRPLVAYPPHLLRSCPILAPPPSLAHHLLSVTLALRKLVPLSGNDDI